MARSVDPESWISRLAGREALLDRLAGDLLAGNGTSVLILHGEAGIGKTALAQALTAAWSAAGGAVEALSSLSSVENAGTRPSGARTLWLLDSAADHLRPSPDDWATLAAALRPGDRLLLVARQPPYAHPLEDADVLDVRLPALSENTAVGLLESLGVAAEMRSAIAGWARGVPLLLILGAQYSHDDPDWDPRHGAPRQLGSRLLRRLNLGPEATASQALLAASVAPGIDRGILGAVCEGEDANASFVALAASTLVEQSGDRLTLHLAARRALTASVSSVDSQQLDDLRCRIADILFAERGRRGVSATVDLAQLSTSARMAIGLRAHEGFHSRVARFSDAEQISAALITGGRPDWWASIKPYLVEAPERVRVTVGPDGALLAYCIVLTTDNAPPCAFADPVFRPWLDHALANDRNALLWRDTVDLRHVSEGPALTTAQATAHAAAVATSGLPNPSRIYAIVRRRLVINQSMLRAMRPEHLAALDANVDGEEISCRLLEFGPQGLAGSLRGLVYFEVGRGRSPFEASARPDPAIIEDAIRNYQHPAVLARSPIAVGATSAERVASVHAVIDDAIASAFGDSRSEETLKEVLVSAYIHPRGGLEAAAFELNMARATYFRKLRAAVDLLVQHLVG